MKIRVRFFHPLFHYVRRDQISFSSAFLHKSIMPVLFRLLAWFQVAVRLSLPHLRGLRIGDLHHSIVAHATDMFISFYLPLVYPFINVIDFTHSPGTLTTFPIHKCLASYFTHLHYSGFQHSRGSDGCFKDSCFGLDCQVFIASYGTILRHTVILAAWMACPLTSVSISLHPDFLFRDILI